MPPLDLGQVEIIKGAASALYGARRSEGSSISCRGRPAEAEREFLINATSQSGQDLTSWLAHPSETTRRGRSWAAIHRI